MPEVIRLGHSPDADDAFMFYPISAGLVDTEGLEFVDVVEEIEQLNRRALRAELEVSAVSIHAYAYLAGHYALLPSGASIGDGYGPIVVAREEMAPGDLSSRRIAVPGTMTTAFLALSLFMPGVKYEVLPFDDIVAAVTDGRVDAGLLIHEGQLTYSEMGLRKVVDLGEWWSGETGLPLPLGGNVVRRDLGPEKMQRIARVIHRSIRSALEHRQDSLAYAMRYGRGMDPELADRFVGMYVNEYTLDFGERGRRGVRELLRRGFGAGLVPEVGEVEFVAPGGTTDGAL